MAVQQLGPEASRAGARRARALAARAGGPTAALVALSTVTVTSLVAIAFAPLPHSVTAGHGGGVIAAPSNVRSLTQPKVVHTPSPSTTKKPGAGSSFTSNPPAAGGTSAGRSSSGGTHSSGGGTSHGGGTGGSGGGVRPGGGSGHGSGGGGTGGGDGTAGHGGGGTGVLTPVCDDPPQTTGVAPTGSTGSPICLVPTNGWHGGGGGHVIVIPHDPITNPDPTGGGNGGEVPGLPTGTKPGTVLPPAPTAGGTSTGGDSGNGAGTGNSGGGDGTAGHGNGNGNGNGGGTTLSPKPGAPVPQATIQAHQIAHAIATAMSGHTTIKPSQPAVVAPAVAHAAVSTPAGLSDAHASSSDAKDSAQAKSTGKHRTAGEHRSCGKHRA